MSVLSPEWRRERISEFLVGGGADVTGSVTHKRPKAGRFEEQA